MIDGRLTRPMAMSTPGMFLSQPGSEMFASYHWPCMTVSIESAMISLDCKLYRIPVVPIEMPSETPMVLNCMGTRPAWETDSLTTLESCSRCMLQGLPLYQTDEMPIWGLFMSDSDRPVA